MTTIQPAGNPYRPGAGHMPPYLAGRDQETTEFRRLLTQRVVLDNMVLTGLRGVGKTVLLDTFKPIAVENQWIWVGTDLSQSSSVSESRLALRLVTDLAVMTSSIDVGKVVLPTMGFHPPTTVSQRLDYHFLTQVLEHTPGLTADKLKAALQLAWDVLRGNDRRGIVFAYDEAQNLADHSSQREYPLSLLLDVFQSLQKQGVPVMLLLTGLPTLFPKLVEARTFAERMFRVVMLDQLNVRDSRNAIVKPIDAAGRPVQLSDRSVRTIIEASGGYPYFLQFICREVYDVFIQLKSKGRGAAVPTEDILRKLDTDFYAGRWARATDRQRELLHIIANLPASDDEFSIQQVVDRSRDRILAAKPFTSSHVSQMLTALAAAGLVYKNRHGRYCFAIPLFGRFILRQQLV